MKRIGPVVAILLLLAQSAVAADKLPKWKTAPVPPPMPTADESGFAEVNGIDMFYSVYGKGNGSPILLIHGGLGSGDIWSFEVPELSKKHEVIVADSRGQGRSTRTKDKLTYHLMAEDYVALLGFLAIGKVTLVGWSDGGIIGLDIAMHHPEVLRRLFAQAPNVTPDGLTSIPVIDPPPPIESTAPLEAPPKLTKAERQQKARERTFRKLWATEPDYTQDELSRITVPTVIAIGDHDPVIKPDHIAYIADSIPGAKVVVLKNVGHPANAQDPKQYINAVKKFMKEG
jgi:pimeloyl-ACP methyl ester carboxylesterase